MLYARFVNKRGPRFCYPVFNNYTKIARCFLGVFFCLFVVRKVR